HCSLPLCLAECGGGCEREHGFNALTDRNLAEKTSTWDDPSSAPASRSCVAQKPQAIAARAAISARRPAERKASSTARGPTGPLPALRRRDRAAGRCSIRDWDAFSSLACPAHKKFVLPALRPISPQSFVEDVQWHPLRPSTVCRRPAGICRNENSQNPSSRP